MKTIVLTNSDLLVLVDDDYWLEFALQNWSIDQEGYARNNSTHEHLHKIIAVRLKIKNPDHKDRNKLNNLKSNFRESTRSQNAVNSNRKQRGTSKYVGVHWHKNSQKWRSKIKVNNLIKHLGSYNNEIDAAKAYNKAALKYFGEFAVLNETS